ncbi:hypothetical protein CDAR_381781 [Caerostris darwini]|uniref:Uncharacterized protein n=1 Tax=Caerostris darwini TaxID=1538125 RepID=A0AAV4V5G1_9ARAC|nr:hypothetical protein CDAR_381781 [Caerostris darwini]
MTLIILSLLYYGRTLETHLIERAAGAISFLECIFSQCSISVLPSIAKWRRTEKEEEIEQNPRFVPSFHSPTLIPTTPLFSIGSLKEEEEKGGGNVIVSVANLSPIDPLLVFLLSFLSVDNENDCWIFIWMTSNPVSSSGVVSLVTFLIGVGEDLAAGVGFRETRIDVQEPFRSSSAFLVSVLSQPPLPSIAKWRRTEKEEEIEQNPRFIPSFHSPTLIPTTPLLSIGRLKEEEEKRGLLFRGVVGVGGQGYWNSGNASNRESGYVQSSSPGTSRRGALLLTGAISFLKCIFSQCSISAAPLPSIAKWRRTEKEEDEIEQNPRFIPSFHSPTLIPTPSTPLFTIGSLKEEKEKGSVFFSVEWSRSGDNVIGSVANLSPIDPLLVFLLSTKTTADFYLEDIQPSFFFWCRLAGDIFNWRRIIFSLYQITQEHLMTSSFWIDRQTYRYQIRVPLDKTKNPPTKRNSIPNFQN